MVVACYCRVSTPEQNLDRQLEATTEYAQKHLETALADTKVYKDKSTGTDTDRSGYQELLTDVEEGLDKQEWYGDGKIDAVVVKSVSRVARSIRDLDRTVDHLEEHDTALHLIDEGIVMEPDNEDPFQRAMFQLLGVFAELEANITQNRVKEGIAIRMNNDDYHHGPAPLGFEKDDGNLIEAQNYDRVRMVLKKVAKGEMSKRHAAKKELDTSRRTINRALERKELYNLDTVNDD